VSFEIRTSLKRVRGITYSIDGRTIVTAGEGHAIEIWDAATGKSLQKFSSKPAKIHALALCGAEQVATGGADNIIRIWDLRRGTELRQLRGHVGSVAALAYDAKSDTLVSGGFDTAIRIWRLDSDDRQDTAAKNEVTTNR
jgi:WD40 repeat protein